VVSTVARQAQATTALVGSFVRAGERIRIHASLQDPSTGEVIASERVEGDPEAGLFMLVDELTTRLRKRLETPSLVRFADKKEKKLQEVTTTSVEAYKAYAEGSRLHERLQERDAKEYFEKAVEADPSFAMALAKLSVVSANLGDVDKAREYSAKAVAKSESLPPGERYYIEGRHYSLDPTKTEKAVAAYQKAVDSAPDHTAARNNLAQALINLHRYPEALVHLEELRRRGMAFPGSYMSLAETYLATGQPDKARDALTSYVAAHPDSSAGLENLGFFELSEGQTDAALAAFDKAAGLAPTEMLKIEKGRAAAHAMRDEWSEAEGCAKRLMSSNDGRERWEGGATLAVASLYRGDVGEARRLAAEGIRTASSAYERVGARLFRARLESDLGRHRAALADAEQAIAEKGAEPKLLAEGHGMRALSLTHLGRAEEAKRSEAMVDAFIATIPRVIGEPYRLQFQGELALARGDQEAARKSLEKAVAVLPPDSISMDSSPVEIRYSLGRAALAEGDDTAARSALAFVVEAGPRRVSTPLPYVRSLALLASLEEKQGRVPEARKLYERYLSYWKHGQIDRTEVARAGQRLAALRTRPVA
jgi:tetratricopeptide (TPR) repeat protein